MKLKNWWKRKDIWKNPSDSQIYKGGDLATEEDTSLLKKNQQTSLLPGQGTPQGSPRRPHCRGEETLSTEEKLSRKERQKRYTIWATKKDKRENTASPTTRQETVLRGVLLDSWSDEDYKETTDAQACGIGTGNPLPEICPVDEEGGNFLEVESGARSTAEAGGGGAHCDKFTLFSQAEAFCTGAEMTYCSSNFSKGEISSTVCRVSSDSGDAIGQTGRRVPPQN